MVFNFNKYFCASTKKSVREESGPQNLDTADGSTGADRMPNRETDVQG